MYEFSEFYGLIILLLVIAILYFVFRMVKERRNEDAQSKGEYTYRFPRPAVTVDILVFAGKGVNLQVLLIKRKYDPFKGRWALPGGFIEMDETLEKAAIRELLEETGIELKQLTQFRGYDDPHRDPRGRTISMAFYSFLEFMPDENKAGDDAEQLKWFPISDLPPLAFDHDKILSDAKQLLIDKLRT